MKMIIKKVSKQQLSPGIKALIKADARLMQSIMDRWDISPITLYQWIQKDYRKLFLDDTLSIIESYLKINRSEFVINAKK